MTGEDKCNRIVMINSFKGGAGKTTAALCRCLWELKNGTYKNVFYIDIDILGTGSSYILSEEGQEFYYNDLIQPDSGRNIFKTARLLASETEKESSFYAAPLNPSYRIRQTYSGQDRLRSHPEVQAVHLRHKLLELLDGIMGLNETFLVVIDCAPGISNLEESILENLYQMERKEKNRLLVEEFYVTTPDASHIEKTIACLNENGEFFIQNSRTVQILINDLYNCEGMSRTDKLENRGKFSFSAEKIVNKLKDELKLESYIIYFKSYSEELMQGNIVGNRVYFENNPSRFDSWPREWKYKK